MMSRTLLSTTVLDGWETLTSSLAPHFLPNINEYEGNMDTPSSEAPILQTRLIDSDYTGPQIGAFRCCLGSLIYAV